MSGNPEDSFFRVPALLTIGQPLIRIVLKKNRKVTVQLVVPSTVFALALRYVAISGLSTVIVPLGLQAEIHTNVYIRTFFILLIVCFTYFLRFFFFSYPIQHVRYGGRNCIKGGVNVACSSRQPDQGALTFYMSMCVRKPTIWIPTRSDTNRLQK